MAKRVQRAALLVIAIALVPGIGVAQGEEFQPTGVSMGNFVISPSVRLSIGYDTNATFEANDLGEDPDSSPVANVNVGIGWAVPYVRFVDLNGEIAFGWTENFAGEGQSDTTSGVGLGGGLNLRFNPRGPVSFNIGDQLRINNDSQFTEENDLDPYTVTFEENGADFSSERIFTNRAMVGIGVHPGGDVGDSRMGFSGHLNANHTYTHYLDRDSLDRQAVGGELGLNWNFLPRSAAIFRASVERTFYDEDFGSFVTTTADELVPQGSSPVARNDNTAYRFTGGIRGLLTERLSADARVGYGFATYENGAEPGQVLALLQLTGHLAPGHRLRGSYSTNFANASFGNFIKYHRLLLQYTLDKGRFGLSASAFWQANIYPDYELEAAAVDIDNGQANASPIILERYSEDRVDYPIGANLRLTLAISRNAQVGAQYRIDANFTEFEARFDDSLGVSDESLQAGDPGFVKHRVFFFVRFAI